MSHFLRVPLLLFVAAACRATSVEPTATTPFVVTLGTAQDGGLPQLGCAAEPCRRARLDPKRRRLVASLLVVDPESGERWLIDATPDLAQQLERAERHAPRPKKTGRPALFDGIFLTHAHIGHYLGLALLGKEAYGTESTAVHGTERMVQYLTDNGPWSLLVSEQRIAPSALAPGVTLQLNERISIRPFHVPHRDEFTDTFGYSIQGPQRSLVYVPDIDKWSVFETPLTELVSAHDYALLDGSFYADGEVPGRSMAEIRHPFIVETMDELSSAAVGVRSKVYFTHLNHTNPAADPTGRAAADIARSGMNVASDGQRFEL